MARRRRNKPKKTESEPDLPVEKFTRPRQFFNSSAEFSQFLIDKMRPGYICRVTNAGKLHIGPMPKRRKR